MSHTSLHSHSHLTHSLKAAHVNRETDQILNLPPVEREAVTYDVSLPPDVAVSSPHAL